MEGSERQSFVMYASFLEAAEKLEPTAFKECVLKLRDYALYGDDVHSKDLAVEIILTMAKPNLNAAAVRYQRCVENGNKGKEHGSKGGRPRKGESREEYLERKWKQETPRKPLNADEDENEKEKENDDVEVIKSPAAMEPTRGSGNGIGFSSSIIEGNPVPDIPITFAVEDAPWISQQVKGMTKTELIKRYEHAIDKIALSKVEGKELNSEGVLAMEAALILMRYDKLSSFKEAKAATKIDIQSAIQQIKENRNGQISRSIEDDEPF